jgi:hypothetical protein
MIDPFMLRQAQHERIGSCKVLIFPFVLSLSKERTGAPDMGRL